MLTTITKEMRYKMNRLRKTIGIHDPQELVNP